MFPSYSYSKLRKTEICGITDRGGPSAISHNLHHSPFSTGFCSCCPMRRLFQNLSPLMVRWMLTSILIHIFHQFIYNFLFTKLMLGMIKKCKFVHLQIFPLKDLGLLKGHSNLIFHNFFLELLFL